MSHTPGPWYWNDSGNLDMLYGRDEAGSIKAVLAHDMESHVHLGDDDARLIAAAPDLLEALETNHYALRHGWRHTPADSCGVCTLIRTARGEGES